MNQCELTGITDFQQSPFEIANWVDNDFLHYAFFVCLKHGFKWKQQQQQHTIYIVFVGDYIF